MFTIHITAWIDWFTIRFETLRTWCT